MKRLVISDSNELKAQALDEDAFCISNDDVELIMNYDSLYELAFQIAKLLKETDESHAETAESDTDFERELSAARNCLH